MEDFTYDYHILISKNIADKTIVGSQYGYNYKDTWETNNYYIEELTHKSIKDKHFYKQLNTPALRNMLKSKIETKKPFAIAVEYNYQEIVLNFLPLPSVDKVPNISYIVTYNVSAYLSRIKVQTNYIELLFYSISFLLYLFVLYVIQNREKLKELALYDTLTNLPNRTLFNIELEHEIIQAKRYDYKLALIFLDLDGFKAVNDTFGHHIGDLLLKEVATKINASIRKVDIASRLGGDEFTIVVTHVKDKEHAQKIAKKILQELNSDITIENNKIKIGASIGIALYPDDANDMQTLLVNADTAMYKAKQNGKNQIFIYKNKEKNNV
jgi:diguanylate cyclase (GGDEF)-like protein